ncbi:MAG: recombination mediator RecR [Candidatus Doudnabacteria bacterium]|nr:recombination mediator RecR [Candidatus Doudnabacteria bacterium]
MTKLPTSLQKLINELGKLPGIGPKTAQRLAFYLFRQDKIDLDNLAQTVAKVKDGIVFCSVCHNMGEFDPCATCKDDRRDHSLVCVVEEPLDAQAIDKSGQFNGVFHVLGGVLNPLEGIGPENLEVQSLLDRIASVGTGLDLSLPENGQRVKEVIIATNPSLEGETTAMHLSKVIRSANSTIKITRIARGLPMGGDLEYADDITLMRAMEGRRDY